MEFVYIEDLIPEDHILRKIDKLYIFILTFIKYIDFSFINDFCRPYLSLFDLGIADSGYSQFFYI